MFVPEDLGTDEAALVATVRRQLRAQRRPTTPAQRRAVDQEADQVAGEMIQAARAATWTDEAPEEPLTEQERYWQRLRSEIAGLDRSTGSLDELDRMEQDGQVTGEWLPASPPPRQSASPPPRR